ncbi:SpvB/TcaC N-terminal domain-containing protein [Mariniflexile sp. AS56]|uniref:SpvB/TcaC N-terminal domain-containing protein n=1 Tax=Mariniflexile sp. AS56 TaxID=3063957 RepID=UPI0026F1D1F9|nr:SpvB/TcaC N-terminal domain-containing protein [Mariniflexile sp. AS56]MDO7174040.1 SpvB/TcaC N-terminal domain-containing protein [Mariniflexile sp. AS56]
MAQEISFLQIDPADLRLLMEASVNPQTGDAVTSMSIPLTSGRNGFQPSLSLAYSSGGGNSVFGLGWALQGIPVISLSLKDGYPNYDGTDKFSFNGQELVPWLEEVVGKWQTRTSENADFFITYFRPVSDSSFTRIEQWKDKITHKINWRVHSTNNTVLVFGLNSDNSTKILDINDSNKIFQWLLEAQYDNMGNAITYEYIEDDYANVDGSSSFERNRIYKGIGNSQKYLKRIRYGNTIPMLPDDSTKPSQNWLFEVVFDYADQDESNLTLYPTLLGAWPVREDPFSSYIAGFEQRTYRLCRRVLMYHHIIELGAGPTLIGSTELLHQANPAGSTLNQISYTGYKRIGADTYDSKIMPPVLFKYTIPEVEHSFHQTSQHSNTNVPIGLNGINYKWVDLYGEGLPGVLYESNEAWYYKSNLGDGNLGSQHRVAQKPSSGFGSYALSDFDGDGNLNIVVLQGRESGYFEFNRDQEEWNGFRPFQDTAHVRQLDTNTQFIDLTGDGRADIVVTEEDRTIWYPSKGKEGFGKPVQIAKALSNGVSRAPTIGSNAMLDYFFTDMNGSGLPDQVRIYNGRIEYWPNMGNGRFGSGIVMQDSPQLDFNSELDAIRIRLVDLDGSGTSDLIYLGRGEITYWINASGNQFLEGVTLKGLPFIDNISSAQIIDYLGDGTPCLVWSSALSIHSDAPLHYLKLTNGVKPRLLSSVENNMGLETRFHYGYSGKHYLRDKFSSTPWITKLPSHRIVVDKLETIDHIGKTRFNQIFEYHDGFFDGEERAFRGFCLVDQYDSEFYDGTSLIPEVAFTDPICVRTWYHNGAPSWQNARTENYYKHDAFSRQLSDYYIEDNNLKSDEFFDAIRSLAGQVIRSETFGLMPTGIRKIHPFNVTHTNYSIRKIQPKKEGNSPCFAVFQRESLQINFEENFDDPHLTHSFNLELDAFGVPIKQGAVVYPRVRIKAKPGQDVFHLNAAQTRVVHFDVQDRYEIGIPLESKSFQIQNDIHPTEGSLYRFSEMLILVNETIATPINFNALFSLRRQAKLLQWNKSFFWNDALSEVLPWTEVGNKVLIHHHETASFNTEFMVDALGAKFSPTLMEDGGYISRDSFWWQPSGTTYYGDKNNFYLPLREEQPNGAFVEYRYDNYHLTLVQSSAVLFNEIGDELARNSIVATIDYNVIAPNQIIDANRNTSEVYYDPLGVVLRSSLYGELLSSNGILETQGHGRLVDHAAPPTLNFDSILANPENYLQECASFFYYELDTWENEVLRLPLRTIALAREQWVNDGEGHYASESRHQISVTYQDGFARTIQSKTLVESGPDTIQYLGDSIVLRADGEPQLITSDDLRWQVSGFVVYNNKQEVVQQYEPYFSPIVDFETDEINATFGQSGLIEYDAIGRQKRINLADGTYTKVEFNPWYSKQYDANDTIVGSPYDTINTPILSADSPEGIALIKSKKHNDTPITAHTDGLGRTFEIEEADENGRIRTNKTTYDALGNPKEVKDARNLIAFTYVHDMQGRVFHETSMDSGEKWQFINALDQPIHLWDARDVHQQLFYDTWGRITHKQVDGALNMNHITERFIYGEDVSITNPWEKNLVGQLVEHYDQAGLNRIHRLDVLGNVLEKDRQLVEDYKSIPDWSDMTSVDWMIDAPFETQAIYDAFGRPTRQRLPDSTIRDATYLQSGILDQLLLTTEDGTIVNQPIIKGQIFNARGQIKESTLGNDVIQQYDYDPSNYRLKQKTSFRRATNTLAAKHYQHINYTYDAVGNITHLIDTARPNSTLLYNQPRVNKYTYDAFYQLIEAEGRTHQAMERTDYAHAPSADGFIKGTRHISLDNMALVRTYTRRYSYDLGGNMISKLHKSGTNHSDAFRSFRNYWISPTSNRSIEQVDLAGNPITNPESRFDQNGNLTYLSHLRNVEWNYLNQLTQATLIERPNGEDDAEYYIYGGDGQRVRKVTQRLDNNSIETTEKIYLDGCEIKRRKQGQTLLLERYTSHLSDGNGRIALMHRWTVDTYGRETNNLSQKKMHYQLNCHLGSSAFELNNVGGIINYEEYFAFGGSAFVYGGNVRDVQLKEYRYSGKERDDATGLYYYGFRYYAPWLCRWLNPDPIGPEDGLNVYQFVHNNPINEVDPDGLQSTLDEEIKEEWRTNNESFTEINPVMQGSARWSRFQHPTFGTVYSFGGRTIDEGNHMIIDIYEVDPISEESFHENVVDNIVDEASEAIRSWSQHRSTENNETPVTNDNFASSDGVTPDQLPDQAQGEDNVEIETLNNNTNNELNHQNQETPPHEISDDQIQTPENVLEGDGTELNDLDEINELDWFEVTRSFLDTFINGALLIMATFALIAVEAITLPFVLVVGLIALVGVGIFSFFSRSNEAEELGMENYESSAALAAIGDPFGVTNIIEGATGRDAVTNRALTTEDRSNRLGSGLGGVALFGAAKPIARAGSVLGTRGLPILRNLIPRTGTQRLLAGIEANPPRGNLHQRVKAIANSLIENGLMTEGNRRSITIALTEGLAETSEGLTTVTILSTSDSSLYARIANNLDILPSGVILGEISQSGTFLHAERQGIIELMFLGIDEIGFTATTILGCPGCQSWLARFAQQFGHLNPRVKPPNPNGIRRGGAISHDNIRRDFPLGIFFDK